MKISIPPGIPAQKLRSILVKDYGITDSAGLAILDAGLPMLTRAEECRRQIEADGLMVPTGKGGTMRHALLSIERDCRALWLQTLRQLNFDVIPSNPGPGRPAGR
jgi:hypothetical protein